MSDSNKESSTSGTTAGTTLVTGGTGGIGRAVVERLVAAGRSVAFTYRRSEERAREIEDASSGLARGFRLDLVDRDGIGPIVEQIDETGPPIDGLVNAAGVQRSQLLAMTSDAAWDEVLDLNLGAAFRCSRAVMRGMVVRRRGAIVNVASLSATHGVAGLSAYAASKAGLLAMTRCLAREVGKRGVRVNAVVPGFVASEMTTEVPEAAIAKLRADECLPTGTSPLAVAHAVYFLLSDEAEAVTGQTLVIDAGTSA